MLTGCRAAAFSTPNDTTMPIDQFAEQLEVFIVNPHRSRALTINENRVALFATRSASGTSLRHREKRLSILEYRTAEAFKLLARHRCQQVFTRRVFTERPNLRVAAGRRVSFLGRSRFRSLSRLVIQPLSKRRSCIRSFISAERYSRNSIG